MIKAPLLALAALAGAIALPTAPAAAQTANQKVLVIFGNDKCPTSSGQEIVVCARRPEGDRYRIPLELRTSEGPASWAQNAKSLEYVGAAGPMSCSTAGAGGQSGCFRQFMAQARAERKTGQQ